MSEPVNTDLHGTVALHWIDLKCAGNKLSMDLPADVIPDRIDECLPSNGEARLIVVELKIVGHQRTKLVELAIVVGGEERGI